MQSNTFAPVTTATQSAVLTMGSSAAYFVDLYIPDILSAAPEFDGSDLTFEYTIDGTNWNTVPGMTVADDEVGYKGRFLVWGSKLRYTSANNVGTAATVAPVVTYKAASMVEVKDDFTSLTQGVLDGDTGNEAFTFGRAPDMLLLDVEGTTFDSVSMVLQGSVDGLNWFDLDGSRVTAAGDYRVFTNPGGLVRFRIEWTGGGLSMVAGRITVIGLTNKDGLGIKKNANVMAAQQTALIDVGTPQGDFTFDDPTGTWDASAQAIVNNNFALVGTETNKTAVAVARIVDALQANGILPTT
jgi:hypothetical protein